MHQGMHGRAALKSGAPSRSGVALCAAAATALIRWLATWLFALLPLPTGVALHNATHLLVQQGLALMIKRRRATYVRFRELWVLAATAHLVYILLTRGARPICL